MEKVLQEPKEESDAVSPAKRQASVNSLSRLKDFKEIPPTAKLREQIWSETLNLIKEYPGESR